VRRRRGIGRGLPRFIAAVLITSGALLIADALLTVVWQEPISAFIAQRHQHGLDRQLTKLKSETQQDKRALAAVRSGRRRLAALAQRAARRATSGSAIGRIELPTLHHSYAMVQGTDTASLRKGPGHYPGTPFPGQHGTVGVAGHRTTYLAPFRQIDELRPGNPLVLSMPYGRFTYAVEATKVVSPTAVWVTRPVGYDRLVLSACHPLYSASERIVVFARLKRELPV
jgi:sortase A